MNQENNCKKQWAKIMADFNKNHGEFQQSNYAESGIPGKQQATPRTDAEEPKFELVRASFARQLERELISALAELINAREYKVCAYKQEAELSRLHCDLERAYIDLGRERAMREELQRHLNPTYKKGQI